MKKKKKPLLSEQPPDVLPVDDVVRGRLGLRVSPQADGPLPHLLAANIQAEFLSFFGRVGDVLVAQEVTEKNVCVGEKKQEDRRELRTRHPNSLLREEEIFRVQLLALSIPHLARVRTVAREIQVPAHALVQAGVHLGEVRRRLAVHKRGQPQPSDVTLTDGEVRDAAKTGHRRQNKNRRPSLDKRLEELSQGPRVPERIVVHHGDELAAGAGQQQLLQPVTQLLGDVGELQAPTKQTFRAHRRGTTGLTFFFKIPFCKHHTEEGSH